jgi:hypothetical protein
VASYDRERMTESVVIDERFRGFEKIAHGGYVGGVLAGFVKGSGATRVSLRRPVPMGRPLRIDDRDDGVVALRNGSEVLAEVTSTTLEFDLPEPVDDAQAEAASRSYPGHRQHLFPGCFCCGPDRSLGDGLRIFPSPVPGRDVVAAPWVPNAADADEHGVVRREIVWAAFDCPQLWSLILGAPTDSADRVVTGALEAQLLGPVIAQERYVVVAWPSGREGRRLFAEAALFSGEGEALGVARQTAVLTGSGIPLGLELWSSSTG